MKTPNYFLINTNTIFFLILSLSLPLLSYSQTQCIPSSPINNGDFEIANGCTPNGCRVVGDAFGSGCVEDWWAVSGSPVLASCISTTVIGQGTFRLDAFTGDYYAGMAYKFKFGNCTHESIATQLTGLIPGKVYTLSFYAAILNPNYPVDFEVALSSGLPTSSNPLGLDPCISLPQNSQLLLPVNNFNSTSWQLFEITFTTQTGLDELVFVPYSSNNGATQGATPILGIDLVSITPCEIDQSADFTMNFQGGRTFQFTDNTPGNIVEWCWDFGDANTSNLQNPTHTYSQDGTYEVCLKVIDENGCFGEICKEIQIGDVSNCDCNETPLVVQGNQTWSTDQVFNHHIIVPNGSKLTINSVIGMAPNCKIFVERNARLNLIGGTLTNECENLKWGGIEVWGNGSLAHPAPQLVMNSLTQYPNDPNDHGVVYIDGGLISNAINAITNDATGPHWPSYGIWGSHWGGIMIGVNSNFWDNERTAAIMKFPREGSLLNISRFINCNFQHFRPRPIDPNNPQLGERSEKEDGITVWDSHGILIDDCLFTDFLKRAVYGENYSATIVRSEFRAFNPNNILNVAIEAQCTPGFILTDEFRVGDPNDPLSTNTFETTVKTGVWAKSVSDLRIAYNEFMTIETGVNISFPSHFGVSKNIFTNGDRGLFLLNTDSDLGSCFSSCNNYSNHEEEGIQAMNNNGCYEFNEEYFSLIDKTDVLIRNLYSFTEAKIDLTLGSVNYPAINNFSGQANIVTSGNVEPSTYYRPDDQYVLANNALEPHCPANYSIPDPSLLSCNGTTLYDFLLRKNFKNDLESECLSLGGIIIGDPPPVDTCQYEGEGCYLYYKGILDSLLNLTSVIDTPQWKIDLSLVEDLKEKEFLKLFREYNYQNNLSALENLFITENSEFATQMLIHLKLQAGNFTEAQLLLNQMPLNFSYSQDYFTVAQIEINRMVGGNSYTLSSQEETNLLTIANTISPYAGNAQALLGIFKGELFEPEYYTGIEERALKIPSKTKLGLEPDKLLVYPNPSKGQTTLVIPEHFKQSTITIVNSIGKTLRILEVSNNKIQIDTQDLPKGIYTIRVESEEREVKITNLVIH